VDVAALTRDVRVETLFHYLKIHGEAVLQHALMACMLEDRVQAVPIHLAAWDAYQSLEHMETSTTIVVATSAARLRCMAHRNADGVLNRDVCSLLDKAFVEAMEHKVDTLLDIEAEQGRTDALRTYVRTGEWPHDEVLFKFLQAYVTWHNIPPPSKLNLSNQDVFQLAQQHPTTSLSSLLTLSRICSN
jgi:hypothetical protein